MTLAAWLRLRRLFVRRPAPITTDDKLAIMRRAVETGNPAVVDMAEVLLRGGPAARTVRRRLGFTTKKWG